MTAILRRLLLKKIVTSGFQIAPDALDYIVGLESPLDIVETIVTGGESIVFPVIISRDFLVSYVDELRPISLEPEISHSEALTDLKLDVESIERPIPEESGERKDGIQVIKNPVFELVGSSGLIDDFLALFEDRFDRIKRIFMRRMDTQGAVSPYIAKMKKRSAQARKSVIQEGGRASPRESTIVLGIVSSKRVGSSSRNIIIELEGGREVDPKNSYEFGREKDRLTCIIPSGREGLKGVQLQEKGNSLLLDETVCISGYVDPGGRMIADDIIFPDIPAARSLGRARRDVYAAFISDLHCGSQEFLEDEFDRFVNWLRGKDVDTADKEMVNQIEYLFVAGDLVDGIGVYPSQKENLLVPDIVGQYQIAAQKLKKLPKRITTVAIPGNHDASRQALPKPPIPKEFAGPLYELGDRIMMMGDPCFLRVEGVKIILTHGDSMDDLVVNSPGASYVSPAIGMKELLRKRHLAPIYGGKTELAPLHHDWLVIDTPPDIIHFGHAHHNAVDVYRQVHIINSGTFQGQTDFMRKQGIIPTPGIVTLVNLRTGNPDVRLFYDLSQLNVG
ncbi:MAG: metallophosphoesterase [Candidatus Thorarchaeota archaeon]|nr:metallophosphoesterase [Candidatus Thorarchaeota archaeon]